MKKEKTIKEVVKWLLGNVREEDYVQVKINIKRNATIGQPIEETQSFDLTVEVREEE